MDHAKQLFQAGKLADAINALIPEVRSNPTDLRRRSFLFELLSFAGEFERAAKHLDVLGQAGPNAGVGALLYKSALAAEKQRLALFSNAGMVPVSDEKASGPGTLNGKPFTTIEDADPRLGCRLEAFIAGEYVLIPFRFIGSLQLSPPRSLRDLLWSSAIVKTSPDFAGKEMGEVLLPVLYPLSFRHPNDAVKLGRETNWETIETGSAAPFGQRLFVLDGEEVVPLLEVRELQFSTGREASNAASS